jgi:hypothetical protein
VKRKRGFRQKSFPVPRTCAEGVAIAVFGKAAGSEAMQLLLRLVHSGPHPGGSTAESRLAVFIQEALSTLEDIADKRRLVAMKLRLGCYHFGIPFTRGFLGECYRLWMPGNEISSSTLSRLFRWANAVDSVL